MRKGLLIITLTMGLLGSMAVRADAQTIGPICLGSNKFANIVMFYFNFTAPNHVIGSGHDISVGSTAHATMVVSAGNAILGITAPSSPAGHHGYMVGATFSLANPTSAPGHCEAINTTGGCGTGSPVVMTIVSCPAGDQLFDSEVAATAGPLMGGPISKP